MSGKREPIKANPIDIPEDILREMLSDIQEAERQDRYTTIALFVLLARAGGKVVIHQSEYETLRGLVVAFHLDPEARTVTVEMASPDESEGPVQ